MSCPRRSAARSARTYSGNSSLPARRVDNDLQRFEVGGYIFAGGIPDDYEGGSIQAVDLETGEVETTYKTAGDVPLRGPNDIVFDAEGGFYFTDYGKSDGVTGDRGRLYYATTDGASIQMIAGGKSLGGSGGGNFLYSPSEFINFDSLGVEAGGNVRVASMVRPGVSVIGPDGDLVEFVDIDTDGDPGITNICWGGKNMKTAYITASSTGKLLKMDWPRPGVSLNFASEAAK